MANPFNLTQKQHALLNELKIAVSEFRDKLNDDISFLGNEINGVYGEFCLDDGLIKMIEDRLGVKAVLLFETDTEVISDLGEIKLFLKVTKTEDKDSVNGYIKFNVTYNYQGSYDWDSRIKFFTEQEFLSTKDKLIHALINGSNSDEISAVFFLNNEEPFGWE